MTLPSGWVEATLGEVADSALGKMLDREKRTRGTPFPYLRNINVRWDAFELDDVFEMPFEDDELERYGVEPGDLLVCEGGEPGRAAVWLGPPSAMKFQKALHRVRPGLALDARFLLHRLRFDAQRGALEEYCSGTTIKHLTGESFRTYSFPVPPLPEQRRIVARLDALLARSRKARESLDRLPALLETLRQSVLAAAFRGDLTKEWREAHPDVEPADKLLERIRAERRCRWEEGLRAKGKDPAKSTYEEPAAVDAEGLPELPDGWAWAPVELLSTKVVDGVHKKPNYVSTGIPFVTVKNLTAGRGISFKTTSFISRADHEEFTKRTNPERDDILISKDGTLGVVRLVETDADFSIFVSVALIKPVLRYMGPYLETALQAPQVQSQMIGVGSGLQHIHLQDLRRDLVPIAPVAEQAEIRRRVMAALGAIDEAGARHARAQETLARLDQSLLARAFRGELVPQDPNDEPASVLLERIRAERAAEGEKPKRGRKAAGAAGAAKRGRG